MEPKLNLLPRKQIIKTTNGRVIHIKRACPLDSLHWNHLKYDHYKALFDSINWGHEKVIYDGKIRSTKRLLSVFATKSISNFLLHINYEKVCKDARSSMVVIHPFESNKLVANLKSRVEDILNTKFTYVDIYYYADGHSHIPYHLDYVWDTYKNTMKCILIFNQKKGSRGLLRLKNISSKEVTTLDLDNGDIISIEGDVNNTFKNSIPKRKQIKTSRICLIFRKFE